MTKSGKSAVVIGGGLAGLTAATLLSKRGCKVTLIEQKNRLGGRTFSFADRTTNDIIDNGQHMMMGCYRYTLRWLNMLGQDQSSLFTRSLRFSFAEPNKKLHALYIPSSPRPFHLIAAVLTYRNLTVRERLSLLRVGALLTFRSIPENMSVEDWLLSLGQSANAIKYFWEPIVLAVMNASLKHASAVLFCTALKRMFLGSSRDAEALIPKSGLSELFVRPAEALIRTQGGAVILNAEVEELISENDRIIEIKLKNHEPIRADVFVSALPPMSLRKVLPITFSEDIPVNSYSSSTILSVYLWLNGEKADHLFEGPFIGCIQTRIHWIFKKSQRLLEVTISDAGELANMDKEGILDLVKMDLKSLFGKFDPESISHFQVIKERSATFNPLVGNSGAKLASKTIYRNLFLAGDWTDTGIPSTIESAVQSGFKAADECLVAL